jgi:hypothetical protein
VNSVLESVNSILANSQNCSRLDQNGVHDAPE